MYEIRRPYTYVDLSETIVEDSHVEVAPLIHQGSLGGILGVERVILGVFVDQVGANGPRFVQVKAVVVDGRDAVGLRV